MSSTVLIIDDSVMIRMQVKRVLEKEGFTVVQATDGQDASQKFEAADPSLVVCDVNMPRMNGIEFLEFMRDAGHKVPVVMLTTEGQPELIRKARALGAKGWLVKPFKPGLLLSAVQKLAAAGV